MGSASRRTTCCSSSALSTMSRLPALELMIEVKMVAKGLPEPATPATASATPPVVSPVVANFASDFCCPTTAPLLPLRQNASHRTPRLRTAVRDASTNRTCNITCCGEETLRALTTFFPSGARPAATRMARSAVCPSPASPVKTTLPLTSPTLMPRPPDPCRTLALNADVSSCTSTSSTPIRRFC